jgi:cytoskeletal protein CcmA (bactofilin family)
MQPSTHIGASIVIKGNVTAQEDVVIAGRLEGSFVADGHRVDVSAGAEVVADVTAAEIVISGQVLGTLTAGKRLELSATADAEGALRAPSIVIADGAVFNGKVETPLAGGRTLKIAS